MENIEHKNPSLLEDWLNSIESIWKNTPEFKIDPKKVRHLAIICDGNRRAARIRGLPAGYGHEAGVEVIKGIARASRKWGIDTLTFWVWSTENWGRSPDEIEFIMSLFTRSLLNDELLRELTENEVRFVHLGRKARLPKELVELVQKIEKKTESFAHFRLNIGLDYGGLDEAVRGYIKMWEAMKDDEDWLERLKDDPSLLLNYLDTAGQPNPDLIIRTGMDKKEVFRTSGFMPFQTAYSAYFFSEDRFPDFEPTTLVKIIQDFQTYQMRRGR